ncbi:MAG TPA: hypothetical protein VFG38_06785 [Pseudomonadales bacterium]|nr:hypothetical protein [Pseudomonadales bacterium]
MSTTRSVSPGKSRRCPHCRSEILESASVCPVCRHHLRFGKAAELPGKRFAALHVEGTLRHPADEDPWEYSVVIAVRNQKGEEVARHVVGIGSMHGNDARTFDLSVDVFAPDMKAMLPEEPPTKTTASTAIRSSTVSAARIVGSAPRTPVSTQPRNPAPARTAPPPPPPRTSPATPPKAPSAPQSRPVSPSATSPKKPTDR